MKQVHKYPRTQHIEGSRLQPGDDNLKSVPFRLIAGRPLVVEEKMDGANAAVSFAPDGALLLQSRGHYLTGGLRERHFNLFKTWANAWASDLRSVLGSRYVMYGEWLYAKHTIYYNQLPHYFMAFDVLDTETGCFLSTVRRRVLLQPLSFLTSVRVLFEGVLHQQADLAALLGVSPFLSNDHIATLRAQAEAQRIDADRAVFETDPSRLMEGLYVKVEEEGVVTERYKFVRADFLTTVLNAQSHWLNRPIIPNLLADGVDLFGGVA